MTDGAHCDRRSDCPAQKYSNRLASSDIHVNTQYCCYWSSCASRAQVVRLFKTQKQGVETWAQGIRAFRTSCLGLRYASALKNYYFTA